MIRLLGAITGSALALATLLVLIGIPQFKAEPNDIDRAVVTLPLPTSPVETTPDVSNEPDAIDRAPPPVPSAPAETPEDITFDDRPAVAQEPLESQVEIADQLFAESATEPDGQAAIDQDAIDQVAIDNAQSWYAFWSPFRSEFAAAGFVDQLQRVTGLDYRVVKVKPGVYEVAFAYIEDTDINNNLSQITAATGLELPEG